MRTSRASSITTILAMAVALTTSAGAIEIEATPIGPKDSLESVAGTAVLLLVFNGTVPMQSVRFSIEGRRKVLIKYSDVPAGPQLHLWRVPAGGLCLERFYWEVQRVERERYRVEPDPDEMLCFDVREGTVTFPGSVEFSGSTYRSGANLQIALRPNVLIRLLRAQRPELLEPGFNWYFSTAPSKDPRPYRPTATEIEAQRAGFGNAFISVTDPKSAEGLKRQGDEARRARELSAKIPAALGFYRRAAEMGHGRAAALACQQFDLGIGVKPDPVKAVEYCRMGVAAGDPFAAWLLERLHARSRGGLQPDEEAQRVLRLQFGDEAELGRILVDDSWGFRDGQGELQDAAEARRLAKVRADADDIQGAFVLAGYLANGIGGDVDGTAAIALYERAASTGRATPWLRIAVLHWEGRAVPRDLAKARANFEKAFELNLYNADELAWFLSTCGDPAVRDGKRAVKLMKDLFVIRRENWSRVDILAAAQAAAGDYHKAARTQSRAIEMAKIDAVSSDTVTALEARLARYQDGKPFVLYE